MSSVSPLDNHSRTTRSASFASTSSPRIFDPRVLDENVDALDRASKATQTTSALNRTLTGWNSTDYRFLPATLEAFDLPMSARDFTEARRALDRNKIFHNMDDAIAVLSPSRARKLALDAPRLQERLNQTLFDMKLSGVSLSDDDSRTFTKAVRAFVQSAFEDVTVRENTYGDQRNRLLRLLPSERRALDNGAAALLNTDALEHQQFRRPRRASDSKTLALGVLTLGAGLPLMQSVAKPQPTSMAKHLFFPQVVGSREDSALLVQCMKEVGYLSRGRKRALSNPEALDAAFALAADNDLVLSEEQRSVARDVCEWFEDQQPRARAQEQQQRGWVTRLFT